MADASGFVETIKKAAREANEAEKPVNVCFGKVISNSPLQINVEQKMVLGEKQLILTRNVTDYTLSVTVNWMTESGLGTHSHTVSGTDGGGDDIYLTTGESNLIHNHSLMGKKNIVIHNGLSIDDEVILIRQQEGQKYIVVDKIGGRR